MNKFTKSTVDACYLYKTWIDFAVRAEMSENASAMLLEMFEDIMEEADHQTRKSDSTNIDVAYNDYVSATVTYLNEIVAGEKKLMPNVYTLLQEADGDED